MGNKNKLYSIALASTALVLFFIFISSTASAAPPTITETRIIANDSYQGMPDIYGNRIVWEDYRNGENYYDFTGNPDIYMYDISTSKETQITTNDSAQWSPVIYGNMIVWQDYRNGNWDIYIFDVSTKKETHTTNGADQIRPDINGDRVVWLDGRDSGGYLSIDGAGGNFDIYMQNLTTKKQTRIATTESLKIDLAIYGNLVVWLDGRNGDGSEERTNHNWDVYMYDLSTKKETRLTTSGSAESPAIYGNRIVWDEVRNENRDIYMYDLSTKKETRITTNESDSYYPAIYGNNIVWSDDRNGNWNIYVYDLSSHQQSFTTSGSNKWSPAIYGNRIVWRDDLNGISNIYMGILGSGSSAPIASFSASPRSGKASLKVQFTDKSTNSPTSWKWSFGDGKYSTSKSPAHIYSKAGKYNVSLTVKNAKGSNTKTMSGYIVVSKK